MWKVLLALLSVFFMISSIAIADGASMKTHKTLKGKDDAKISCNYCHATAKIPKKKGLDKAALSKNPYCSNKGCHH